MAGPCDGEPLASTEWVSLYKKGWAPEMVVEYQAELGVT